MLVLSFFFGGGGGEGGGIVLQVSGLLRVSLFSLV